MSDNHRKLDDPVNRQQSIDSFQKPPERQNFLFDFFSDFLTGFGALFLIGVVLFLIVPVAVLGACMILIALFGKFIKSLIKK